MTNNIPDYVQRLLNMSPDDFYLECNKISEDKELVNDYVWSQAYIVKEISSHNSKIKTDLVKLCQDRMRSRAHSYWNIELPKKENETQKKEMIIENIIDELNRMRVCVDELTNRIQILEQKTKI